MEPTPTEEPLTQWASIEEKVRHKSGSVWWRKLFPRFQWDHGILLNNFNIIIVPHVVFTIKLCLKRLASAISSHS
jgi:hypothetical protein